MKDLFSLQSEHYAKYRPHYPAALYAYLYSLLEARHTAWDAGTGNGQVAAELAKVFHNVIGTDISERQLSHAKPAGNIIYIESGEILSDVADHTFDLITVAQAIHWFDREVFYKEVMRVAKPRAVLAVWCYTMIKVNPAIDGILLDFYKNVTGPYWDGERSLVDEEYRTLDFPFDELEAPPFHIESEWSLKDMEGYLNSWSAVQHYIKANHKNPVNDVIKRMRPHWNGIMPVSFPVFMRVGRV